MLVTDFLRRQYNESTTTLLQPAVTLKLVTL